MEKRMKAIGASTGLAHGRVLWLHNQVGQTNTSVSITPDMVEAEAQRFQTAVSQATDAIAVIQAQTAATVGEAEADVFQAHIGFLGDPAYTGEIVNRIARDLITSESACEAVTSEMSDMLSAVADEYISARAADIRDVGERLLSILRHRQTESLATQLLPGCVLVADELAPSQMAQLTPDVVVAVITRRGSKAGHAAIIARTLGIPMVVGAGDALALLFDGTTVIVDGDAGVVDVNPGEDDLASVIAREERLAAARKRALTATHEQATTVDGVRIRVYANIGTAEDATSVVSNGAEGIGLFRTEFLYQESHHWPTEAEQFTAYRDVLKALAGAPVTIRTLDIGGDKPLPYAQLPAECNPFLGERAIRFCLTHIDIFKVQLRSLLRSSVFGDLHVMLPMIGTVEEIDATRALLRQCRDELHAEGYQTAEFKLGIMVEIPAAAVMADVLAERVDFMSVGTNDLIQYTLAVDRANERVADLYEPVHPALLRLIATTCAAAQRADIPVAICGEMAGDVRLTELLIGLGVTELSMSANRIAEVKARIRGVHSGAARRLAEEVKNAASPSEVWQKISTPSESTR